MKTLKISDHPVLNDGWYVNPQANSGLILVMRTRVVACVVHVKSDTFYPFVLNGDPALFNTILPECKSLDEAKEAVFVALKDK